MSLRSAALIAGVRCGEEPRIAFARDDSAALHVAVAKSPNSSAAARDLVCERYASRGYNLEDPAHALVESRHERSSQEITFLVALSQATVGTLTLALDGPHGLRAEASYDDVIDRFRAAGRRACELTCLALARRRLQSRARSPFSLAHAVGRTLHDVTDVFIEVNPRHVGFYSRVLGFLVAAGEKFCERVRAPSVLLHLELEGLELRLGLLNVTALMQPLVARAA